jgi:adenine-specific DNA-methyltransferase
MPIKLPITRYYGSKRKLINQIWEEIEKLEIEFESVLDIFGGSGVFSYYAKTKGKTVYYNDIFKFNYLIGKTLIQQNKNELTYDEAVSLLKPKENKIYHSTIETHFEGIYFTKQENQQIDIFVQNIQELSSENKKLSAYYLLFQSCIIKRPYNLFHRKNLYMRENFTSGNFGNKKTWERSFEELFIRFIDELNKFSFENNRNNLSFNYSALDCPVVADLIYIDPPYIKSDGTNTSYHSKYHFLEGLASYNNIIEYINYSKKNKEIQIGKSSEFENHTNFTMEMTKLLLKHSNSIIVLSYRNNGFPSIEQLSELMQQCKPGMKIYTVDLGQYGYALNKDNSNNREFLIIGSNTPVD